MGKYNIDTTSIQYLAKKKKKRYNKGMSNMFLVCIVLLTVAVIISVVYFVVAINQITQTAKKLEKVLDKTGCELDSIHKISGKILDVADLFPRTWMKIATTVLPLATSFVFKKRK